MKISEKQIQGLILIVTQVSTFVGVSLTVEGVEDAKNLIDEILAQQSDELKEVGDE